MKANNEQDFIIIYEDRTENDAFSLSNIIGGTPVKLPALPNTLEGKVYVDEVFSSLRNNTLKAIVVLIDRLAYEVSGPLFEQFTVAASQIKKPIIMCSVAKNLQPMTTWRKDGYYWINIKETNKIKSTIEDLRNPRENKNITESAELNDVIKEAMHDERVKYLTELKDFYFELLLEKWIEFDSINLPNPVWLLAKFKSSLPTNEEFEIEANEEINFSFADLLKEFDESKLRFQDYYNNLKEGPKRYVFTLIGEIISYFDEKAYNRKNWNKTPDLRRVARSTVRQSNWVKNLLRYKINGINDTSDSIYNAIQFILNPAQNLTILSENHRKQISENLLQISYNYESFTIQILSFFRRYNIKIKNELNTGVVFSSIIYLPELQKIWRDSDEPIIEQEKADDNYEDEAEEDSFDYPENFTITESDEGMIGVKKLAAIMSNLLIKLEESDKGKMIGVFGNWGRGKTFLMDKIWTNIRAEKETIFIRVDFHAWKYQDTPAAWAYLYEAFAKEYFKKKEGEGSFKTEYNNFFKELELNYTRLSIKPWLKIIGLVILAVIGYKFSHGYNQILRYFIFFGAISASTAQLLASLKNSFSKDAKELFKKYYTKVSFTHLLGIQAEIQKELKLLLKAWIKEKNGKVSNKIILFVDDIDRCSEERIISVIDSLRVMLEDDEISKRVIILSAIDERVLKRAIKWKYHDLIIKDCEIDTTGRAEVSQTITNEYMDKLFLSGIRLGTLNYHERKDILSKYIGNRVYRNKPTKENEGLRSIAEAIPKNVPKKQSKIDRSLATEKLEEENQKSENNKVDYTKYDLLEEEEKFLSNMLEYNSTMTPRKIRIFYYRYLLARNILKDKLNEVGRRPSEHLLNDLARFIMHYTVLNNLNVIHESKSKLILFDGEATSFSIFGSNEVFNTNDLILIHEVLETVIAY